MEITTRRYHFCPRSLDTNRGGPKGAVVTVCTAIVTLAVTQPKRRQLMMERCRTSDYTIFAMALILSHALFLTIRNVLH